jgi:ABC-type branched-subunit amino acid transport system substrate-binding protein
VERLRATGFGKKGMLGRPVELVYYDDQSNPSLVPSIYTKLLDVDKADVVISSYGTPASTWLPMKSLRSR